MEIEQQLLETTKERASKRSESRQDYLKRLAKAVDQLEDDGWDQLSEDTQQWYNKAAEAIKAKEAIEDFEPADDDDAEADNEAEDDDETAAEAEAEEAEVEAVTKKETSKVAKTAKIARVSTNGADGEKKTRRVASSARRTTSKVRERSDRSERKVRAKSHDGDGPGAPELIRQLVMKNPQATAKDCRDMLEQKGKSVTSFTVSSVLAAAKATMRAAKDAGLLKSGFDI
jgi:hypothetical protein